MPDYGVMRGSSTFVALSTSDPDVAILRPDTFQHVALDVPRAERGDDPISRPGAYPRSLMGVIVVVRQTFFDAQFQAADLAHYAAHPQGRPRPKFDTGLEALQPAARKAMPVLFEPASVLMMDRAMQLAQELGVQPVLLATGQEWRRPELVRAAKTGFIVPVDFPEAAKLPEDDDWRVMSYDLLRAWDHAPGNPALLRNEGREIALTTHGLAKKTSFRANVRLAIARGLSENDALAALTTMPAKLCGVADQLGSIEPGKLAHLTVVEKGRYFDEDARVREVWVDGRLFSGPIKDDKKKSDDTKPDTKKEKQALRAQLTAAPAQTDRGPILAPKSVLIRNATIWTCAPPPAPKCPRGRPCCPCCPCCAVNCRS